MGEKPTVGKIEYAPGYKADLMRERQSYAVLYERATTAYKKLEGERDRLKSLLFEASAVLEYVSRGKGFFGVEPYPDATARRVLGAIMEETGNTRSPNEEPA